MNQTFRAAIKAQASPIALQDQKPYTMGATKTTTSPTMTVSGTPTLAKSPNAYIHRLSGPSG